MVKLLKRPFCKFLQIVMCPVSLAALFFLFFAATFLSISPATFAANMPRLEEKDAQEAVEVLFHYRSLALKRLEDKISLSETELNEHLQEIIPQAEAIGDEYQKLLAKGQIAYNLPLDQYIILGQLQRLQNVLTSSLNIFAKLERSLKADIEEITNFEARFEDFAQNATDKEELRAYQLRLQNIRDLSGKLNRRLQRVLGPLKKLQKQIAEERQSIKEDMPGMWKEYYFSAPGRFFASSDLLSLVNDQDTFFSLLKDRLENMLPHEARDIGFAFLRGIIALVFLFVLALFLQKRFCLLPDTIRPGILRAAKNGLPLFFVGLSLYAAAFDSLNPWPLLLIIGSMLLSYGQMCFSSSIRLCHNPKGSIAVPKFAQSLSLWPLFIGIFLLLLALPQGLTNLLWAVILIIWIAVEWRIKLPLDTLPLEKKIFATHKIMLWLFLGISLAGFGPLTMLGGLFFVILATLLQQIAAFVQISNDVSLTMRKTGLASLLSGLALGLIVPALIVFFSLSLGLWFLIFPGGDYLLRQLAGFGISLGGVSFNFIQVLLILSAFYITRSAIDAGRFFLDNLPERGLLPDKALTGPLQTIFAYILWALFFIYALNALGFSLTSLAVIAGGLSVGVGFGLQSVVNNFISGLLLIFGQNIREGDIIEVEGITGIVRKVAIRATTLQTPDNSIIFIPNANLLTNKLINWTRNGNKVRRNINIGLAYGSDVEKAIKILNEIAASCPAVCKDPAPTVVFSEFADSALNIRLRVFVDIEAESMILTDLRLKINQAFAENDISMPFPQLDVHLPDNLNNLPWQNKG